MEEITTITRAPGKIILSGEHSVVYGRPALALAVDRFVTTTVIQQPGHGIWFEVLNDGAKDVVTMESLHELRFAVSKRYRKYTVGKLAIAEVITSPLELIKYAFIYLVDNLFLEINGGLKIQIEASMPMGCGMGASSAVILSLAHALVSYHGQTLAMDKYLYFSREIENLQHGRSSGLDLYLSLYGGAYFFTNGIASRRSISAFPLKVVNTGRPFSSTGQCVEHASKFFQSGSMLDEFAQTTIAMDKAWQKNRLDEFAQAVSKNHQLLCEIEVVPDTVKNFIGEVEKLGGAAKISGAGSVQGESGGIVLVVGDLDLNELSTKYGYEILAVRGMNGGLEIV